MPKFNHLEREILTTLRSKSLIVDDRETLSVEGARLSSGIDGTRTLAIFLAGVEMDVDELGLKDATKLYRIIGKTPGRLGKALKSATRLCRETDADMINER